MNTDALKIKIRDIPDFPKPGIIFKDITPLLDDAASFQSVIDHWAQRYADKQITRVVGIESRGFIFASALAYRLDAGFVPVRKPGKLPYEVKGVDYALEYGTDRVEMHVDALQKHDRVILVDDVLATGGTAAATCELIQGFESEVVECAFVIELDFLNGRDKLKGQEIHSLLHY